MKTSPRTIDSLEKLLELSETTESGCMVFTRKWRSVDGYGRLSVGRKRWSAHRYAWFLVNGEIPSNMCIMHTCDNPSCINPQHLRLGTFAENNQDREAKGRSAPVQLENHPRTNLTNEQVREIKRLYRDTNLTHRQVASLFGVTHHAVAKIKGGKNWAGVSI